MSKFGSCLVVLLFLAGVGFLAAYLGTNYEEVLYLKDAVPKPSLFFVHGSGLLFESLGLPGSLGKVFVLGLLGLGAWIVCRPGDGGIPDGSRSGRWYILGYSIFLFCYSLNSNYDYRFVYVLPMVPLLLSFYRRRAAAPGRGWAAGAMLVLLIPILWTDIWFMHAGREDGRWTMEYITVATAGKNVLLAAFMVGATYFAAQLLRPNLRQLFAAFVGGRNQSLEKKA